MPLEAFNSSASIINVLTGGVNSVGRSLLLGQQDIQTNAVRSTQAGEWRCRMVRIPFVMLVI